MGYNKHQTFYLRINWISKAIKYFHSEGGAFFADEENFKKFGIGKNMFISLRFWLEATGVFEYVKAQKTYRLTKFGEYLDRFDNKVTSDFSRILLHYNLTSKDYQFKSEKNHVFYWYFNCFDDIVSSKESMLINLKEWSKSDNVSDKSLKSDIDCLVNLYTKIDQDTPEDLKISILGQLGLIRITSNNIYKMPIEPDNYDLDAFFLILLRWKELNGILDIESITSLPDSIGRIFNLNRSEVISLIDQMIDNNYPIRIDRTNEINTIHIDVSISSVEYLQNVVKSK